MTDIDATERQIILDAAFGGMVKKFITDPNNRLTECDDIVVRIWDFYHIIYKGEERKGE